jgi:hypothetical protein
MSATVSWNSTNTVYTEIKAIDIISKVVDSSVFRQNTCKRGRAFSCFYMLRVSDLRYSLSLTLRCMNLRTMMT